MRHEGIDAGEIEDFLRDGFATVVGRTSRFTNGYPAEAEDAVQEAVARAWQRLTSEDIRSLPAWITTVAANLARSEARRRVIEERALRRLGREGLTAGLSDGGSEDVAAAVAELPRRQREVVVLHYYGDVAVREVATVLGISEGTVKEALHRARRTLGPAVAGATGRGGPMRTTTDGVKGWFMSGTHFGEYDHGVSEDVRYDGKRAAFLRCRVDKPGGFGTLMQMISAENYRGKRLRLSAAVKTDDAGWVGLWMRVDGDTAGRGKDMLAFDNMQDRPIAGTTEWARYEVVLDVAEEAAAIALGMLVSGSGQAWVADYRLEEVSMDIPTTGRHGKGYPQAPVNLDFSED